MTLEEETESRLSPVVHVKADFCPSASECHQYISWYFSGTGSLRQQSEIPRPPFSGHLLQLFWWHTEAFPSQLRDIITPSDLGSAPRPHPCGSCLKHFAWEAFRPHSEQLLYSELLALSLRINTDALRLLLATFICSSFFWSLPTASKWRSLPLGSALCSKQQTETITSDAAPFCLSVSRMPHLFFPSLSVSHLLVVFLPPSPIPHKAFYFSLAN